MSTEDGLRAAILRAIAQGIAEDHSLGSLTDAVFECLPPPPVLAWCAANPEAAKGLASGEMVAGPKPIGADLLRELVENPPPPNEALKALFREHRDNQAASTPVTSDEAQGAPPTLCEDCPPPSSPGRVRCSQCPRRNVRLSTAPGDSDGTYEVGA